MTKTLAEVIRYHRKKLKLSQSQFAELVGYDQRTISDWETGRSAQIRNPDKVADILGLVRDEFNALIQKTLEENPDLKRISPKFKTIANSEKTTLDSNLDKSHPVKTELLVKTAPMLGLRDVPVYGRAQGGDDGEFIFNGEIMGWEQRPLTLEGVREAYAVYVDGTSMYPRYKPGETVWVNPNRPPRREDDVIVQIHHEDPSEPPRGYIKEFVGWAGNDLVVRQHNPAVEIRYPRELVVSVHLIVYAQRSG